MVVVMPLEVATRLAELARAYELTLPIPLSSPCQSFASPEEIGLIQSALLSIAPQSPEASGLLNALETYTQDPVPMVHCAYPLPNQSDKAE